MDKFNEEEISFYIKKNKLKFPRFLEDLFREDYFYKSIRIIRLAIVMGFILYATFGILDYYLAPLSRNLIWIIRYGIVCPLLVLTFLLSFFDVFKKIVQPVMGVASMVAGLGIVAMIAISLDKASDNYYYAGLILVIMWAFTFVRLKFIYATIVCWLIVLGYELTSIFLKDMLSSPSMIKVFLNNNFFFIGANVIGMFAGYLIELYTRKDFLQRLLIAEKQKNIEKERDELSKKNNIIINELRMARRIQQQLIPAENPSDEIFSLYKPMEEVGGDLYDFIKFRENNKIGIFLSDVSGHGVPAALITSMLKSFLSNSSESKHNPSMLLSHLNQMLVNQTGDNFITAFYGIYEPLTRILTYSNAGHNPPFVIFNEKIELLNYEKGKSIPLAIIDNNQLSEIDQSYSNNRVMLPAKSKLLLYTDGLLEAKKHDGEDKNHFFSEVAEKIFIEFQELNCRDFITSIYARLIEFKETEEFEDDICMICVDVL